MFVCVCACVCVCMCVCLGTCSVYVRGEGESSDVGTLLAVVRHRAHIFRTTHNT